MRYALAAARAKGRANETCIAGDPDDIVDCGNDTERDGDPGARDVVRHGDTFAAAARGVHGRRTSAGSGSAARHGVAGYSSGRVDLCPETDSARWRASWLRRIR